MAYDAHREFMRSYEENADALFRHILFRIGGDREKAKDILQECFTRTWSVLARGKEVENLRAYFYRAVHNLIVDEYGARKNVSLDMLAEEENFDTPDESKHSDPELSAEQQELMRAMRKLPEQYRDVLTLRYIDDLGPSEIAEFLDESANNVSVRINRATEALRKILKI